MSTQERLTMSQILKITPNGTSEIVTNDAVIQPGQHSFANQEALYAYLVQTFVAKVQNGGVTGSFARTGKYERRSAEGAPAITFGNPILDTISSAAGSLVIEGRTIDLTPLRSSINMPDRASGPSGGVVTFDAPALKRVGIVNDAEKWALDDGSYVEYRIGNGRLGFQAWRNGHSVTDLGLWSMGIGISVWNTPATYESAFINALNFISATGPCQPKLAGGNGRISDYSGTHVELSDWGFNAQQPERVAGVCMAQWHHRQFADLVTAGSECPDYMQHFMNPTFPEDWNPIPTEVNLNGNWTDGSARNAVISVSRRSFSIDMSAFGRPTANGTIDGFTNITAIFPDDRTYKGQLQGNAIWWSNGSQWTKVENTVFDLNGTWSDGGLWVAVIFAGPTSLTVDMSDFDRPTAYGEIIDSSTITVTFPDDLAYTGTLIAQAAQGTIRWSNGSMWIKKG